MSDEKKIKKLKLLVFIETVYIVVSIAIMTYNYFA
jgi:hypothetical protein